jgi:hypothetical protein
MFLWLATRRDEHFIASIVFLSKYPIYHLFLVLAERCPNVFRSEQTKICLIELTKIILRRFRVAMAGIPGQKWTQGEKRSPGNMKAVNHELAAIPKRCLNFTSSYLAI